MQHSSKADSIVATRAAVLSVLVADEMAQPHGIVTLPTAMLMNASTATGAPGHCMDGQLASWFCRAACVEQVL